ncbi:MAG: glycosyltransferase [Ruminococcaceae bacterium]|nr:glycosyltransferase [Oscillospiraceae bacterium]
MSKTISVIVPVYNVENYLRQCLDSIVGQTFQDIEVLVINDGSPDNSQAIIDEYCHRYPDMVRSYIKENGGLSDARNYGIERAEGEYIAFVDSDDYLSPEMFEQMIKRARENDSDVVACMIMSVWSDGRYETQRSELIKYAGHSITESPEQLLLVKSYAWNKIYRRKLFTETGIRFPIQYFEDSAMVYNLLYYANRVDYVPYPLYYYRRERPGAITTDVSPKIFDIFKSCDSIIGMYSKLPDYKENFEDVIVRLVTGHITARFSALIGVRNKKLARKYLNQAYEYLNRNAPDWKKKMKSGLNGEKPAETRYFSRVKRSKTLMKLLVASPIKSAGSLRSMKQKARSFAKKVTGRNRKAAKANANKAAALKAVGFDLIRKAGEVAQSVNVKLFADFGTLLGFIRENGFMDHDIDLDMGVILGDVSYETFHDALVKNGFKLWRQYIVGCIVAEESYYFDMNGHRIKCDFNYYEMTDEYARTWLFYRKPDVLYGKNTRNVVEMNYSPITGIATRDVAGHEIPVPADPEKLLREKYGENWTKKDTGWIYWKSPAATPVDEIGFFVTRKNG